MPGTVTFPSPYPPANGTVIPPRAREGCPPTRAENRAGHFFPLLVEVPSAARENAIDASCRRLARIADQIDQQAKYTAEVAARARGVVVRTQKILDDLKAKHG